jgi:hypothetical protein
MFAERTDVSEVERRMITLRERGKKNFDEEAIGRFGFASER